MKSKLTEDEAWRLARLITGLKRAGRGAKAARLSAMLQPLACRRFKPSNSHGVKARLRTRSR